VDNQPKQTLIEGLLSQVGISSDFVKTVRFRGPVGKMALVGLACILALGAVGVRSVNPLVQTLCISLLAGVALFIAVGILWYSTKFPDQATLEGMEVVVMHRQKAWAAKGMAGLPPDSTIIPDPSGTPPQQNPPQDPEL